MKKVAIIGFGRFGKLISQILTDHTDVEIFVVSSAVHQNTERVKFISLKDIDQADVVIPTVPISVFEETILKISPFLKKDAVVIDVCSVKVLPVQIMKKHLPKTVRIIASHPVFGPDSVIKNNGVTNLPITLFPVRCDQQTFQKIVQFCEKITLKVVEVSPEEHDKFAAYTQAYAFLIGKIGQRMKLPETPIDTWWYSLLKEQCQIVQRDSNQLFLDIQSKNPYAKEMRKKFKATVESLLTEIDEGMA